MGKSAPAAPAAPDYRQAAIDQGAANVETARVQSKLNNPNVYTPYGTQLVSYSGDTPTITQSLTPAAQKTLNEQQNVQYQLAQLGSKGTQLAGNVLDKPFNFGGPAVQTSFNQGGPLQSAPTAGQYGLAGTVNPGSYGQASAIDAGQYGLANAANLGDYGQAAGIDASRYGMAQGGVNAPNLASSLDLSNVANMPINAGMSAQEAIMSRLQPSLQKNRVSTETQLINQGLRPGTEAYDNAIQLLGQQENDARQQAVLQGIGLDLSANQQGYGQALQSAGFGNQAQLSGFGANLQNQQAANQAIAQNYGQGVNAQQMQNQAIAQNFGQGQAINQAQNAAIAQNFAQGQAASQAQNAAIAQNFGQGTSAQQMQNQAIGQNYGQGMSSAQSQNAIEAQRYNQALQGAQFGNTAQQQALAQAIQGRQMPLNEISALMSGSQIQNPQFQAYSGSNIAAAPMYGAAQAQGQAAQNAYNQQVAQQNANTAGMFGLGGSVLGAAGSAGGFGALFSDRRLKSNIVKVGDHPLGIGIYEYDIFGNRERGVMAQELMQVMPDAVHQHSSGYFMVDYGRL
jgi:hypothetical protein